MRPALAQQAWGLLSGLVLEMWSRKPNRDVRDYGPDSGRPDFRPWSRYERMQRRPERCGAYRGDGKSAREDMSDGSTPARMTNLTPSSNDQSKSRSNEK
jgi:hypothetical protein